jgi:Site-specific recombinase XerD
MDRISLDALLDSYERIRGVSQSTMTSMRSVIRVLQRDIGISWLHEVSDENISSWRNEILRRSSAVTWNTYRRTLVVLLNHARNSGVPAPELHVRSIRIGKMLPKDLSQQQIADTINWLGSPGCTISHGWFWQTLLTTLYTTGIRRRQVCALRWRDVDLMRQILRLSIEGSKTRREWTITLHDLTTQRLRELHVRSVAMGAGTPTRQVFNVNLFRGRAGEMTINQLDLFWKRLHQLHPQTPRLSAHKFRHTFATAQARTGLLRELQEVLGHANLNTTLRYVHPNVESMRAFTNRLDVALISRQLTDAQSD